MRPARVEEVSMRLERTLVGLNGISLFAEELRVRRAGSLRIAGMPAVTCGFLTRHIGRFVACRPEIAVSLHGLPSHLVADGVASGAMI